MTADRETKIPPTQDREERGLYNLDQLENPPPKPVDSDSGEPSPPPESESDGSA